MDGSNRLYMWTRPRRLVYTVRVREVGGSNPLSPTEVIIIRKVESHVHANMGLRVYGAWNYYQPDGAGWAGAGWDGAHGGMFTCSAATEAARRDGRRACGIVLV